MKCNYCGNTATKKTYRTWDGITGSSRECNDCASLTNEGVLNINAYYVKAKDDLPDAEIEDIIDLAMAEFWDVVNEKVSEEGDEMQVNFKDEHSMELYEDDLDAWKESMYDKIQKTLKKQL